MVAWQQSLLGELLRFSGVQIYYIDGVWQVYGINHAVLGVICNRGDDMYAYYRTPCQIVTMDFPVGDDYSLEQDLAVRPTVVEGVPVTCFECVVWREKW